MEISTWCFQICRDTCLQKLLKNELLEVRNPQLCGVSLKDMKRSEVLYSLLGVQSMAEMARRGRLRWCLGMWNVRVEIIRCRPVEMWRW